MGLWFLAFDFSGRAAGLVISRQAKLRPSLPAATPPLPATIPAYALSHTDLLRAAYGVGGTDVGVMVPGGEGCGSSGREGRPTSYGYLFPICYAADTPRPGTDAAYGVLGEKKILYKDYNSFKRIAERL
eukprot:990893-Rhodomonas_salina.1